ncbi:MAG: DoxX family protein [Actinomycetota bacterium]|nr:DoxX family protein [Actinomycetota bacterium]
MELLGLRPGRPWAYPAAPSELGGTLTVLGFLNPFAPPGVTGSVAIATKKAHPGNPMRLTEGGAELPVTNVAAATALILSGPGQYLLDRALGIKLPAWPAPLGLAGIIRRSATPAIRHLPEENEARQEEG